MTKDISNTGRDAVAMASGDMASLNAAYGPVSRSVPGHVSRPLAEQRRQSLYRVYAKRAVDLALVLLATPFWVPLVLLGALMVMIDGHNPFYSQERLGRDGRVFRIWKLRSMVPDADAVLDGYLDANPEARAEWNATQKLKDDPRITMVGRILRKTSLDELPQLVNVLTGDMSLVGPRPIMVSQKAMYPGRRYYDMRPGLTGLWQVAERNACSFAGRGRFDDIYHRTMSFGTDLRILMKTVTVVMRGTGY